jgi:osmoprotectant transport system permease protein
MSTKAKVTAIAVALAVMAMILILVRPSSGGGAGSLKAGFDAEFLTRPDGYAGLRSAYGFAFSARPSQLDSGLMYKAAADGAVDVIDAFATDGRIKAYGLVVLVDDKGFFPPYYAAPLVRRATLEELPQVGRALATLAATLTDATMQGLNYEVDEKGRRASDVASEFLAGAGLVAEDASARSGEAGSITIGGKQFTEQEVLGEVMARLIECTTDVGVVRKLNLGGTMICFNALKAGDLDLYAEYTGTGLVNILKRDVIPDPDAAYDAVKVAFEKEYGLVWLAPFGFNNTYTLTMRRAHAKELGIETISDLASYVKAGEQ